MAKLTTSTDIGNFLAAADSAAGRDALGLPFATQQEAEAGTETNPRSFSPERIAQAIAALGGGGGVDGSAIILATSDDDLSVKYAEAKALTPNGNALSATNRAALVLMPGLYTLSAELAVDTNFVDVIGLGAGEFTPAVEFAGDTINVTASDVRVVGISVGTQEFKVNPTIITGVTGTASNNTINLPNHGLQRGQAFFFSSLTGGSPLQENTTYFVAQSFFGNNSFRVALGPNQFFTFIGDDITDATIVLLETPKQRFHCCAGGDDSFGGNGGKSTGTFTNCTGDQRSFGGGNGGTASGTFINCTGENNSFGGNGTASGTFENCTGSEFSFGGNGGTASGTFTNCTAKGSSFGGGFGGIASGKFTNCTGGDNSFGTGGTASGTFTNCTGGVFCFGGNGTASGTFTNCTGGQLSFGTFGFLSGKLYYCRLMFGTFETVSGGGITRLCIDGNNVENNQG